MRVACALAMALAAAACGGPGGAARRMMDDVRALVASECAGRMTGTNGAHTAAAHIARALEEAGLEVLRQPFPIPDREGARG